MATRVKRYEAQLDQFDALLARIEAEMGPNARLETREFRRGGVMGLGAQRMVEVIATVNVDVLSGAAPKKSTGPRPLSEAAGARAADSRNPWTRPGISISADGAAYPTNESSVSNRPAGASGAGAAAAQLNAAYSVSHRTQFPHPAGDPAGPRTGELNEERIRTQLAELKQELARQRRQFEATDPDVEAKTERPDTPRVLDPAQSELDSLRESLAELSASVRKLQQEQTVEEELTLQQTRLQQQAQQQTHEQPRRILLAQQGGGPAVGRSTVGQTAYSTNLVERSETGPRDFETPVEMVEAVSADDMPALWELVEPVRIGASQTGDLETEIARIEEFDYPELPSMKAVDSSALDRQLEEIKQRASLRLLSSNIDNDHAQELVSRAAQELARHFSFAGASSAVVEEALLTEIQGEICRDILIGGGIEVRGGTPGKVVALVGPTGVGKTTSIAKLAAHFAYQRGRSVGLVSLDTYRVAAAEQLRCYADIMGLPIKVAYSPDEFDEALVEARSRYEITLVDTAGASPLGGRQLAELQQAFSLHRPDEVHLVLAATTKADDLRLILDNFAPLNYKRLILSKLDETRGLGALYNVNRYASAPISYFAVGQSVPEDLRVAELDFIQHWITTGAVK